MSEKEKIPKPSISTLRKWMEEDRKKAKHNQEKRFRRLEIGAFESFQAYNRAEAGT